MKIFYLASNDFYSSENQDIYQKTINYLQFKAGKKNLKTTARAEEVQNKPDEIVKAVRKGEKELRESDVVIIDATKASSEIGFVLAMAVNEKKPILLLEREGQPTDEKISFGILEASSHRQLTRKSYKTIEDVTKLVDNFLEEAKSKIDTKFILIIPPEIDRYLTWAADFRRMHKAQVVRRSIEQSMQKDKDWKDFLASGSGF